MTQMLMPRVKGLSYKISKHLCDLTSGTVVKIVPYQEVTSKCVH